ncbi:hypothetical protein [Candidatus Pantoea multigeneris]|uniref:Uncharacterized protein n=1 Tax=Candidatus Pantoea multigeneris TaxID=2608357 RepID=A0ABX0RG80_9GAMM|nr:hypothetical protein [Pantoea multigeneris]NIF23291.1 hypothetical protein [Pantoea multigeneris]
MKMIELRKVTNAEFRIRNRLQDRVIYSLSSTEMSGYLKVSDFCHDNPGDDVTYYTCLHGDFATELSLYSLNIFSDYILTERKITCEMSDKHWELYNLKMYENVRKLLGYIKPHCNGSLSSGWVCGRVECNIDKETIVGNVYFSHKILLSMIKNNTHQFHSTERRLNIPISFPVDIATHTLPFRSLSLLKPGALIIPSQQNFSTDGNGALLFDQIRVTGVIDNNKSSVFIVDSIVVNGT